MLSINGKRMMERVRELGTIGKDTEGRRTRLAASDEDKAGRDKFLLTHPVWDVTLHIAHYNHTTPYITRWTYNSFRIILILPLKRIFFKRTSRIFLITDSSPVSFKY